jgi:hypothetical protein
MLARLSSSEYPELAKLRTRDRHDASIALLDCWATVADVLTFYQERLANEGYLWTATERRSVLELARLIGYRLRPGVAASVFLAYEIDSSQKEPVVIPVGAKVQSVPGPGELPQTFETSDPLESRANWNNLQVRRTRPQYIPDSDDANKRPFLYLNGTATNLKVNDALYFEFSDKPDPAGIWLVDTVTTDFQNDRTVISLQPQPTKKPAATSGGADRGGSVGITKLGDLRGALTKDRFLPPPSSQRLGRNAVELFSPTSDLGVKVLAELEPKLQPSLYAAWANAKATPDSSLKAVYAFRVKASLFGHNAPRQLRPLIRGEGQPPAFTIDAEPTFETMWSEFIVKILRETQDFKKLLLDTTYDQIKPGSWVYVAGPMLGEKVLRSVHKVSEVESRTLDVGTFSSKVTILTLESRWLTGPEAHAVMTEESGNAGVEHAFFLRQVTVYAQSEELPLADEPIGDCVGGTELEVGQLVANLIPGRWLIVSGEREDITGQGGEIVRGVMASELVMLAGVKQDVSYIPQVNTEKIGWPGDRVHTFLQLADKGLSYCYRRDTVKIYGNVVKATHGETRQEVLGSGDASKSLQSFALKQPPLTYVSAPTPNGVQSTLVVRVNDVRWAESDSLAGLGPIDRRYTTRTDDDAKTTVVFGNGEKGVRLPTGVENIRALYRNGIGKGANVRAEQITLLATRPLGVKGVTNPLRASGGADKDTRDQAKRNAPLTVMALDRLVSTQDYADFARTFAGIGKAQATRLPGGQQQLVYVTIAGADDIPIEESSDLYRHLTTALREFGDPYVPIRVAVRELNMLVISAEVALHPGYEWESVERQIRATLLDGFGFDRRELGQSVFASEVISVIQHVRGVAHVDLNIFDSVAEHELLNEAALKKKLADWAKKQVGRPDQAVTAALAKRNSDGTIQPAQLVVLTPAVSDTLILNVRTALP